ncbi:hypothetical protein M5E88_12450 [Akkermansia muciniphila]|nr:hypothetical protein M5E88_12450 [Akkermansia muciniphila]
MAMGDSFLLKDMVWVMLADVACICVTASWFLRRVFPSLPVCWTVLLTAGYAVGAFSRPSTGSCSSWTMPPCSPVCPGPLPAGERGKGLAVCRRPLPAGYLPVQRFHGRRHRLDVRVGLYAAPEGDAGTPRAPGPRVLVHGGGNAGHLLLLAADGGNEPGFHAFPVYDAAHVFELSWPFDPPKFLERLYACLPGMSFAALAAVYLACGKKASPAPDRGRRLFILLLAASVLPAFVEPIHRAAHLWSYVDFPVRFGFIPNLAVMSFCAWILSGGRLPGPAGRPWGWGWSLGLPIAAFFFSLFVLKMTAADLAVRLLPLLFFACAWLCWRHVEGKRLAWSIASVMMLGLPIGAAAFWKQGRRRKPPSRRSMRNGWRAA